MAHCSYEEAKKQKAGWDNPPKARECFLGFTKTKAEREPAIIIYDPRTGERAIIDSVDIKLLTEAVWEKLVATLNTFPEKLSVGPERLVNKLRGILRDRGEGFSTGTSNQND